MMFRTCLESVRYLNQVQFVSEMAMNMYNHKWFSLACFVVFLKYVFIRRSALVALFVHVAGITDIYLIRVHISDNSSFRALLQSSIHHLL